MRKFRSSFVSASDRSWLSRLVDFLFPPPQTQRRPPVQPAIIYTETPPHIFLLRQRGKEARMLLHKYIDGWPTSRRAWVAAGHKEGAWRRGRAILLKAKLIDVDGDLRYGKRDSLRRLHTHLDEVEQRCWQSGRFVSPW